MSVSLSYDLIARNLERSLTLTAQKGPVKLESTYWREHIGAVRSLEDFLADTRLFTFAMEAFGLGELAHAKGYMRKVLEEGIADPKSLANRTQDLKIREFARTFDFAAFGDLTTQRAAAGEAVVERYVRQSLEVEAGEADGEGVRLALYFERMAPTIEGPFDILADPALAKVARTALGLPSEFSAADLDRQAEVLSARLDLDSFTDPEAVGRFLTRFTALWDVSEGSGSDPVLALFGGTASGPSLSLELAMSLTSLRLGGA